MVIAWVLTLPAAGLVGAVCWFLANAIGGALGVAVVFAILVAAAAGMYFRSRRTAINPDNVNSEWEGGLAVHEHPSPEPVPAGSPIERN
jgi:PiT family inorganic phosphate transporter